MTRDVVQALQRLLLPESILIVTETNVRRVQTEPAPPDGLLYSYKVEQTLTDGLTYDKAPRAMARRKSCLALKDCDNFEATDVFLFSIGKKFRRNCKIFAQVRASPYA